MRKTRKLFQRLLDRLHELAEEPVKINSPEKEENLKIIFSIRLQVKLWQDYVHTTGQIVSSMNLPTFPDLIRNRRNGLSLSSLSKIKWQLARIQSDGKISYIKFLFQNRCKWCILFRLWWKILTKYKFTSGGFSGGFTLEKDPGEKLISGKPPLPDFLSAHLLLMDRTCQENYYWRLFYTDCQVPI